MNPGAMRETLEIYDRRSEKNATGYVSVQDVLICTVRGRLTWTSDKEVWEAYAAQVKSVISYECRYHASVRVGQWVKWRGQWQEIIAVQLPAGFPRRMILKTAQKNAK